MGKLIRKSSEGVRSRKKRESLLLKQEQRREEQRRREQEEQLRLEEHRRARAEKERSLAAAAEQKRAADLKGRLLLGAYKRRKQLDMLLVAGAVLKFTIKTKAAGKVRMLFTGRSEQLAEPGGRAGALPAAWNGTEWRSGTHSFSGAREGAAASPWAGWTVKRKSRIASAPDSTATGMEAQMKGDVAGPPKAPGRQRLAQYGLRHEQQRQRSMQEGERTVKRRLRRQPARSPCRLNRRETEVMRRLS